ncbi:Membrane protein involved in the export of O-antigen and teichoic acid [Eubacterium aggregans]|uniref:Membrane protein involved in the export of O-antigen and teichoic acid n=1 Tax=Eubacterium aggregans TaxID=81409 RepID=A0A1H3YBJ3_9FIRM|nr:oligosaccharide flippase family protein [Eubacterium aggregans]SEA08288.1 Membrane protein involved in the export of O-antigen and teichoic acid [Eubacterium aggregans]
MVQENRKRQLSLNMITNIIAFILNLFLNFFISPYIINQLGSEAYGYVKLANDFVNYATLITIALNSMASRFITIALYEGKKERANQYYSSIAISNIVLSTILIIPSFLCVYFLEDLIEIPISLQFDVKITFGVVFLNFLINLVFTTPGLCFFMKNRLDISYRKNIDSIILRFVTIIILFLFLKPRIVYMALGTTISTLYIVVVNIHYKKVLLPEMEFKVQYFDFSTLKEVLSSGVWNSLTKLSQIFSSGLDLLITNLYIDAAAMGLLSVAKTIPNVIVSFLGSLAGVFCPDFTILYAQGKKEELIESIEGAMKIMSIISAIPNAILLSLGVEFYKLWVPGEPAQVLQILSVLTVVNSCVTGPLQPIYQIFTVTNKVKQSSIVMILYGFSSILVTLLLVRTTNLGVFAVAGVSLIGSLIVALFYHLPFGAHYLNLPWWSFFPEIGKSVLSFFVTVGIGYFLKLFLSVDSWIGWFVAAIIILVLGLTINFYLILSKKERNSCKNMIISKVRRK